MKLKLPRAPKTDRPSHPAVFSVTSGDVTIIISSVNFGRESQRNERRLRQNAHSNKLLQAEFNRTGECDVTLLEQCDAHEHVELRKMWRARLNIKPGNYGFSRPCSDSVKQKLSAAMIAHWASPKGDVNRQRVIEGVSTYWNSDAGVLRRMELSNLLKSGLSISEAQKLAAAKANSMKDK